MREILVTNPSMIGTAIKDPNTINGQASGAALDPETSSMPHSLGKDGTDDSERINAEREEILTNEEEIANRRKAHAAERSVAAAQPEHPDAPKNVDIVTGGASPSTEFVTSAQRPAPVNLDDQLPASVSPNGNPVIEQPPIDTDV